MDVREIIRSNNPVLLSFAASVLAEAGIHHHLAHAHDASLEGSIGVVEQRLLVAPDRYDEAHRLLVDAEALDAPPA
ncbi:hypothetical protein UO65_5650 [Actinokineospora spheciospongiae]|uniref:DUF2007 domain-containing protein n=1 Tax=Actinokineospora spheciospongiae TaxID=909613 RepID=W7IFM1_9PSEU|nr:hypothetical protein UO65_5650 [Actinokineospora spheciospongiae]